MKVLDNREYKVEVKEKWGETAAYQEHAEKTRDYSQQKWDDLAGEMNQIMAEFALRMKQGEAPASVTAQDLVVKLQNHITEHYYRCTKEILAGLGQMYVADARFQKNIDRHAAGTAVFIRDAIAFYCTGQ